MIHSCAADAETGSRRRNNSHSGQGDTAAQELGEGEPFAERSGGDRDAYQRGCGHDHAGRASRDVELTPVEQQLVGRHPEEGAGGHHGQVPPGGQSHRQPWGQRQQGDGGHGQAREREAQHPEVGGGHPDRGEGTGPHHHYGATCQNAPNRSHVPSIGPKTDHVY